MAQDENSNLCCETGARSGGSAHDPECYRWISPIRPESLSFSPTLRDQFAMAALTSLGGSLSPEDTAEAAYEYADAMLEARKPKA